MRSGSERGERGSVGAASYNSRRRRHEQAVIEAEVRRLVHAIRPYGVLRRDALAHAAGASHWHTSFDQALLAAVRQGRLREQPLGYYSRPHEGAPGHQQA